MAGFLAMASLWLAACSQPADAQNPPSPSSPGVGQDGAPYVLGGTQVWSVPDSVSGRNYQVFVSLPRDYEAHPGRLYPVVYVTDADYAFPIIRQIARRVNLEGPVVEDFILVGLSYAVGDSGADSRRRDYTPSPNGPRANRSAEHGGGPAYQTYLKTHALPFIEARFRADPARRVLLGHSYGGLLGAQILFSEPELFDGYILGSPSLWFDDHLMLGQEAEYARSHRDLPARIYMYVGEFEAMRPGPRYNRTVDMVGDNARFEQRLRSRNYPGLTLTSDVLNDEDHLTVAPRGFTKGLMAILPARP